MKILDPTCGSGSFLIKAFDYLYADLEDREESKQYKLDGQGSYSVKTAILKKNLYGVDLDNKAVEITKLNLLLKAAEKDRKLPEEIDLHIRHGNSLIDDETIDKNAFLWKNDFQVETFDVIIGNPPYVHQKGEKDAPKISFSERDYYRNNYKSVHLENSKSRGGIKLNLFVPYVETAIKLLKPNGRLGFIVHKNILKVESYKLLRKFILENCKIERIVDLGAGVFPEVTGETVIMVLQKNGGEMRNNSNEIKVIYDLKAPSDLLNEQGKIQKIKQDSFEHTVDNMFSIYVNKKMELLGVKLFLNSKKFGEVARIISFGLNTIDNKKFVSKTKTNQNFKHCLMGRDIGRYSIKNKSRFVLYDKKVLDRTGDEAAFNAKEKLIFQRIGAGIIGTYDAEKFYCFNSTNMILPKENGFPLKYMLGLLNSKLLNFYYRAFFSTESSLTVNVTQGYLSQLPIRNPTKSQESNVVQKVEKILLLNNRLSEIGEKNTAESKNLKDKIASISKEIDEEVYRLYEISGEEKKIIENRTI